MGTARFRYDCRVPYAVLRRRPRPSQPPLAISCRVDDEAAELHVGGRSFRWSVPYPESLRHLFRGLWLELNHPLLEELDWNAADPAPAPELEFELDGHGIGPLRWTEREPRTGYAGWQMGSGDVLTFPPWRHPIGALATLARILPEGRLDDAALAADWGYPARPATPSSVDATGLVSALPYDATRWSVVEWRLDPPAIVAGGVRTGCATPGEALWSALVLEARMRRDPWRTEALVPNRIPSPAPSPERWCTVERGASRLQLSRPVVEENTWAVEVSFGLQQRVYGAGESPLEAIHVALHRIGWIGDPG